MFCLALAVGAQNQKMGKGSDTKTKKYYKPGSAWTLDTQLGIRQPNTMDTLMYNYQRTFIPSMTYDAFATTGQLSGPGLSMLYFERPDDHKFFFNNALSPWIPTLEKTKFYNVYIPMTLLTYNLTFDRESRTDFLRGVFAGNVNRKIGVGGWIDYPYTKGSYTDQAAKAVDFGLNFYYTGDHYQTQMLFNHYRHVNKENGGITNDLYITNPAEVQGGVNEIEPKRAFF